MQKTQQGDSRRAEIATLHAMGLNQREISDKLGIAKSTVSEHMAILRESGKFPAPDGFNTVKTSTLFDAEGNIKLQWVKSDVDKERKEAAEKAAFSALCENMPRADPVPLTQSTLSSLLNLYTFTDCHVGMLAWDKESGDDWDVKIAEKVLSKAFDAMMRSAPCAGTALINQLGDFLHIDGLIPVTPTSKNVLDADSRFSKIVAVSVRILRRMINRALEYHDTVHVLMADANHDPASQVWLRHMFAALYENEPRVIVNQGETPFYAMMHGQTMLGFHHGHMVKLENLPLIMATQYPKMWGSTSKRYVHTGHLHNSHELEMNGMKVIQHPTLAAKDAYASRHGWLSQRQAACITYHQEFGEVARSIITPEMLT